MARKWYLWVYQDEDSGEYLWDFENDIDLTCIGAVVEPVDVQQVVHPTKRIRYKPVVKYDEDGNPYAEDEARVEWKPSYESFCARGGHNHTQRETARGPLYECTLTKYAWSLRFSSQEELELFLINYEPDIEYISELGEYGFLLDASAWDIIQEKQKCSH
jgi:hypothetical protein